MEDDFLDPVPETPVFDCVMDIKPEADPASLTVKAMGLQERWGQWRLGGLCRPLSSQLPADSDSQCPRQMWPHSLAGVDRRVCPCVDEKPRDDDKKQSV